MITLSCQIWILVAQFYLCMSISNMVVLVMIFLVVLFLPDFWLVYGIFLPVNITILPLYIIYWPNHLPLVTRSCFLTGPRMKVNRQRFICKKDYEHLKFCTILFLLHITVLYQNIRGETRYHFMFLTWHIRSIHFMWWKNAIHVYLRDHHKLMIYFVTVHFLSSFWMLAFTCFCQRLWTT